MQPSKTMYLPRGFTGSRDAALAVDTGLLRELSAYLRLRRTELLRVPIDEIIGALDRAAAHWIAEAADGADALVPAIAHATGLSEPVVRRAIHAEQTSSRAADLGAALDAELGSRYALDGFVQQPRLHRYARAVGPELVFGVLPGNIPGLSHLPVMRSLLVKSPILAKAASGEPYYAAAYARTLADLHPVIAECIAVLSWRGGTDDLDRAAVDTAEATIVFGGVDAIAYYNRIVPRDRALFTHGHKLGVVIADAVVASSPTTVAAIAEDVCMYDQMACLAPHRIFVRGAGVAVERFASRLADAMETWHATFPSASDPRAAVARRNYLDDVEFGHGGEIRTVRSGAWGGVVLDRRAAPEPTCGYRTIAVTPVEDYATALRQIGRWRPWLQNASLAVAKNDRAELAEALALLGVTRIAPPGAMPYPSMRWRHDGRLCLAELVRFTDIEDAAEHPFRRGWL